MAIQTRRTTRRSARFFRATVKASVVTACCGLVLWSAVAAHAATPWNGLPFNGAMLNGTPLNGMPFNGTPWNGLPYNGAVLNGTPFNDLPTKEGSLPTVQREHLPWSTLSHRALGEAAAPALRDSRDTLPGELPTVR
jgi:hypothetical protein